MAEAALAEFLTALAKQQAEGQEVLRPTLASWGESWILGRSNRAADTDRSRWARYVRMSPFYFLALSDITPRQIRQWLATLAQQSALRPGRGGKWVAGGQSLSLQSQRHALNLLRRCLGDAVEQELISSNPAAIVKVRGQAPAQEVNFLTESEIATLLGAEDMPLSVRCALTVAIYAGLRQGEQLALRWGDLDLDGERPQIAVRRSVRGPTKTGRVRYVPLLAPALACLKQWRAMAGEVSPDAPVWASANGSGYHRGYDFGWADRKLRGHVVAGWKTLAGIRRRVRYHDLRHTCASHLIMGTWGEAWSLSEVAALLGHSRTTTTEIYAHLSPDHLHKKAAVTALGSVQGGPQTWPQKPPTEALTPPITVSAPGRNRTCDPRLRRPDEIDLFSTGSPTPGDHLGATLPTLALTILQAAARGEPVPVAAIEGLATALLPHPLQQLAHRALCPDDFQLRAGIDLASRVLATLLPAQQPATTASPAARPAMDTNARDVDQMPLLAAV